MKKNLKSAVLCSVACMSLYTQSGLLDIKTVYAAEYAENVKVDGGSIEYKDDSVHVIQKPNIEGAPDSVLTREDTTLTGSMFEVNSYNDKGSENVKKVDVLNGTVSISGTSIENKSIYGTVIFLHSMADADERGGPKILKSENGVVQISDNSIISASGHEITGSRIDTQQSYAYANNGEVSIKDSEINCSSIKGSYAVSWTGKADTQNGKINIENSNVTTSSYYNPDSNNNLGSAIVGNYSKAVYEGTEKMFANNGQVIAKDSSINGGIVGSIAQGGENSNLEASDNEVVIMNTSVTKGVIGGRVYFGTTSSSNENKVTITDKSVVEGDIYGGYVSSLNTMTSNDNTVNIYDSEVTGNIYGTLVTTSSQANGDKTETNNNTIEIVNSIINKNAENKGDGDIYGGAANNKGNTESNNNSIHIKNSKTEHNIIVGYASSYNNKGYNDPTASAQNNEIIIEGKDNSFKDITAGYAEVWKGGSVEIKDNNITLLNANGANYNESNLYGYDYYLDADSQNNTVIEGNTLTLDNWSGTVKSINNFNDIEFKNIQWENGGIVLGLLENEENSLKDTVISLTGSTVINNGTKLQVGDYMYFINHDNDVNLGTDSNNVKCDDNNIFTSGVAVEGKGAVEVEADGDVKYTITEVGTTDQAKATTDYNSVAAAFLIYGSDLVVDGLNAMEQDQLFGVKTFAIVEGVDKTFEVADDLKVNGWNGLYGVGNIKKTDDGVLSYAAFFENGTANYRVYNSFMDEAFRGNGSIVYNGGGIAGRYKKDGGVYAEASVRAGMLKNQMKDIFRDGNGNAYGYDTENPYWALHVGTGKIYDVGENKDLDVYARYYHTYNDGDSFMAAGDRFDVDSVTSNRLRLGMRYNTNKDKKWQTYYGAAYEYEFSGDSKVHINDDTLVKESMKGSSCFAEIGFNYQRDKKSSWDFEGRLRGYVGETKGISGMLRVNYSF